MGITTALTTVGSVLFISSMNKFLAIVCLAAAATGEADPYLLGYGGYAGYGGYGLGYSGYGGYGYAAPVVAAGGYASVSPSASVSIAGLAPAAIPAIPGPAAAGRYVANSAGTVHVAKREADPYFYGGYGLGYAGYGGYAGYAGYGYAAAPVVAAAPVITGYSNVSPSASLNIAGAAPAAIPAIPGPAAAGRYVANSAGTVHVA